MEKEWTFQQMVFVLKQLHNYKKKKKKQTSISVYLRWTRELKYIGKHTSNSGGKQKCLSEDKKSKNSKKIKPTKILRIDQFTSVYTKVAFILWK